MLIEVNFLLFEQYDLLSEGVASTNVIRILRPINLCPLLVQFGGFGIVNIATWYVIRVFFYYLDLQKEILK